MTFTLHWPQAIWLAMQVFWVIRNIERHGKPEDSKYNGYSATAAFVVLALLQWWGGFFG